MQQRALGFLMPLFSLPGPFGCGQMGPELVSFARQMVRAGFRAWLLLPLNPVGKANSPYSSLSSFAGNPYYIDLRELIKQGLLTAAEVRSAEVKNPPQYIDYTKFAHTQIALLHRAYQHLGSREQAKLDQYAEQNSSWLTDYAAYMTLRDYFGGISCLHWPDRDLAMCRQAVVRKFLQQHREDYRYYLFEQYLFDRQWQALKLQLKPMGLTLIGDLPMYPASDSADFWANRRYFQTTPDGLPSRQAGVPPDAFSPHGQCWENPLYDWSRLKAAGYDFWIHRMERALQLYDAVRIDHFRALANYWSVPFEATTAEQGHWEKGPGSDFIRCLKKTFPHAPWIAEDLGIIDAAVTDLLTEADLPGMSVLQFAFDDLNPDSCDLPHRYPSKLVAFTGTHDNTTLLAWAQIQDPIHRAWICDYFKIPQEARQQPETTNRICRQAIESMIASPADLVILPIADLLGKDSTYRINHPGTVSDLNWSIRLRRQEIRGIDQARLRALAKAAGRL